MQPSNQPIRSLINLLYGNRQPPLISQLSDGIIFSEILGLVENFPIQKQKVCHQISNWTVSLTNIRYLVSCIQQFYEQQLNKVFHAGDIELAQICKNKNQENIVKFFEVILGVFMMASNKDFFIQKILLLDKHHQEYFVSMIQKVIGQSPQRKDDEIQQNELLEKMDELESQNELLKNQVSELLKKNEQLTYELKQCQHNLQCYRIDNQKLKAVAQQLQQQILKQKPVENTNNGLVQYLKQKLLKSSMEHEKEIIQYQEEITMMENQISKINQLQTLVDMYKENYEQALEHLSKINVWQKDKEQMIKIIQEKSELIADLQQTNFDQQELIKQLQQQVLDARMQYQKINIRYVQLEQNVRKRLSLSQPSEKIRVGRVTLASICPQIDQESYKYKYEDSLRDVQKKNKKIKDLQKQIIKLKEKASRILQLEKQKSRLQNVIVDYTQSRGEQIQLLTTCLHQLRLKYKTLIEQFKPSLERRSSRIGIRS